MIERVEGRVDDRKGRGKNPKIFHGLDSWEFFYITAIVGSFGL